MIINYFKFGDRNYFASSPKQLNDIDKYALNNLNCTWKSFVDDDANHFVTPIIKHCQNVYTQKVVKKWWRKYIKSVIEQQVKSVDVSPYSFVGYMERYNVNKDKCIYALYPYNTIVDTDFKNNPQQIIFDIKEGLPILVQQPKNWEEVSELLSMDARLISQFDTSLVNNNILSNKSPRIVLGELSVMFNAILKQCKQEQKQYIRYLNDKEKDIIEAYLRDCKKRYERYSTRCLKKAYYDGIDFYMDKSKEKESQREDED